MTNLISCDRKIIGDIVGVVNKIKSDEEEYCIKYRTKFQSKIFPTEYSKEIGYGNLIDFCDHKTVVIGYPGSAMIECFKNNIAFFPYCNLDKFILNSTFNKLLSNYLFIAKNKEELLDNILSNRVFKEGYSKEDVLHNDAKYLKEVVKNILNQNI